MKRFYALTALLIVTLSSVALAADTKLFWDYDDESEISIHDEFLFGSSTRGGLANILWPNLVSEIILDGALVTTTAAEDFLDSDDIGVTVQAFDADIPTAEPTAGETSAGTETAVRSWSPAVVSAAIGGYLERIYGHSTPLDAEPVGEWVGQIALVDNDSFDPADIPGTFPYYAVCTSTGSPGEWVGFLSASGSLLVNSIELLEYYADELNDDTTPHTLIDAELKGTLLTNYNETAAIVLQAPAAAAGWNFTVQVMAEYNIEIAPDGTEQWYLNGTQLAAGESIVNESPTVGESIVCFSAQSGASTYSVFCESKYSDWAEETP